MLNIIINNIIINILYNFLLSRKKLVLLKDPKIQLNTNLKIILFKQNNHVGNLSMMSNML